jgi:hypothetical protein
VKKLVAGALLLVPFAQAQTQRRFDVASLKAVGLAQGFRGGPERAIRHGSLARA